MSLAAVIGASLVLYPRVSFLTLVGTVAGLTLLARKPWTRVARKPGGGDGTAAGHGPARAVWVITGALLVAANLLAQTRPTLVERGFASGMVLMAAYAVSRWRQGRDFRIPLLPVSTMMYALYFAMPVFTRTTDAPLLLTPVTEAGLQEALLVSFFGLGSLLVGYYSLRRSTVEVRSGEHHSFQWGLAGTRLWAAALGLLGLVAYMILLVQSVPAVVAQSLGLLSSLTLLAAVLLFVLRQYGEVGRWADWYLWGILVPLRMLIGLGSGFNFAAAELVIILGMAAWTLNRRISSGAIVLGLSVLIFLQPIKTEFREKYGFADQSSLSPVTRGTEFAAIAVSGMTRQFAYRDAFDQFSRRHGFLNAFSVVVVATPKTVPYWDGTTYKPLLSLAIPRVVFSGKPRENTGATFGHRYGLLAANDDVTSYNLPVIIEFYANFGLVGVLIGMFLLGMLYRAIATFFARRMSSPASIAAAVYVLSGLLLIEVNLSLAIEQVAYRMIVVASLAWLTRLIQPRTPRAAMPAAAGLLPSPGS
ncbi:MAG: hypothetical protein ACR2KK_09630 [Acidimicrobiales bacterium]